MSDRKFAHLHLHTHYSLLDGFNRIPELVKQTKKLGMSACAITDHGNLYGAIEFYTECQKGGINPIIGYEAYVAGTDRREKKKDEHGEQYYHLTLLAKNAVGFRNLVKLSSYAFLEGFYYQPRIDRELLAAHAEGLICLSGCLAGMVNQYLLRGLTKKAEDLVGWYRKLFGEDFYLEIQENGLDLQSQCNEDLIRIANKKGIPLVATADAHYLCSDDAIAHDVLFCINTRRNHDPRKKAYPEGRLPNPYYVRSPEVMYQLFPGQEAAVARSQEIADKVDIQLDFKKRHFPVFRAPEGKTADEYLRELCTQGVYERYGIEPKQEVWDRLDHELAVISKMGYAAYFLIVWDFVRYAREKGIPSTARGSGCGAVVAYTLYLSHVCPLEYDLLFERFLDPNRTEPPDIDIDFCQERRELVIQYVKEKYGHDSVAQIGTFGTLAAKAALKDTGRVMGIPLEKVNAMCKFVPMKGAIALGLKDAMEVPEFKAEYTSDPTVKNWVDIAMKLEGTNRNVGTHAAGVVIADGPITNYIPVQRAMRKSDDQEGGKGDDKGEMVVTTQWEMGIIEKVGMLKMDFLGLRNLTVLDNAVKLIKKTRGLDVDPLKFPLDDRPTFELLQRGDAKGVFQLESEGIRELLKQMKPDNIRDLIAVLALYRPGPLGGGMVDAYVNRKHGREQWQDAHPVMTDVLSETYGVMVYQEQIMRILNRLGGIELSKAYACIKAISKKIQDKIDATRADFVTGAGERGVATEVAEDIFAKIVFFAGYGFNKSHTAAYAQIGYQTAYLKTHFTAEFMAALLSSEIDDGNKRDVMVDHIADARKLGVDVEPPNVNQGQPDFDVVKGKIIFGLTAIKGLGRGAAEEIVRAREAGGPFRDLFDFCERVDQRIVKSAAIEKVIKSGAMDCFGKNKRAAMFHALPRAVEAAEQKAADKRRGQKNIFDIFDASDEEATNRYGFREGLGDVPEWPELEKLKLEKEALDFYISSHPLAQFDAQLSRFRTHDASGITKLNPGVEVRIGGMVVEHIPKVVTKGRNQGNRWAIVRVEDFSGSVKCILWSDQYARFKDLVTPDAILLFEGKVEWRDGSTEPDLIVDRVMTMDDARTDLTKEMVIRIPYAEDDETYGKIDRLRVLLPNYRGQTPVWLVVRDPAGKMARMRLPQNYWVNPATIRMDELDTFLGPGCVFFNGR